MDVQINLFVSSEEYRSLPGSWSGAADFQTDHGQEFGAACEILPAGICWARDISNDPNGDVASTFRFFKLYREPAIVFVDTSAGRAIAALRSSQISKKRILEIYDGLRSLEAVVDPQTGITGYIDEDGSYFSAEDIAAPFRSPFGLGLFNLKIPMPAWLWLLAAGAAGYKALTAKKDVQRTLFGTSAVIALGNYTNAK